MITDNYITSEGIGSYIYLKDLNNSTSILIDKILNRFNNNERINKLFYVIINDENKYFIHLFYRINEYYKSERFIIYNEYKYDGFIFTKIDFNEETIDKSLDKFDYTLYDLLSGFNIFKKYNISDDKLYVVKINIDFTIFHYITNDTYEEFSRSTFNKKTNCKYYLNYLNEKRHVLHAKNIKDQDTIIQLLNTIIKYEQLKINKLYI